MVGKGKALSSRPPSATEIAPETPAIAHRRPRRSNRPPGPAAPSITIGNVTSAAVDGSEARAQTVRRIGIACSRGTITATAAITA